MVPMSRIEIRPAKESDLDAIHSLAFQLGYTPSKQDVVNGFIRMSSHPDYEIIVITADDLVVGKMTLNVRYRVENPAFLQITAIVTNESVRGQGYGKRLMEYAEQQARAKGFSSVVLYSNKKRTDAHNFYKSLGYLGNKESIFFVKNLD